MADTYEKDLGAKSAITSSDYIRVVGSDNVSYKQPMSFFPTRAEVDALKTVSSITPSEVASDITNNLFIRKQNGVVTINGYITRTNAFTSTQTQVMILPTGARPASQVRAACALSGAAYNPPAAMGYLLVDSTGYMAITAPASNTSKVAYFSVSYMAEA